MQLFVVPKDGISAEYGAHAATNSGAHHGSHLESIKAIHLPWLDGGHAKCHIFITLMKEGKPHRDRSHQAISFGKLLNRVLVARNKHDRHTGYLSQSLLQTPITSADNEAAVCSDSLHYAVVRIRSFVHARKPFEARVARHLQG